MSVLVYYFILHLCVSMHACNSRHLGMFHKEPRSKEFRLTSKTPEAITEVEGENIKETVIEEKESKLEFLSQEQNMHKGSDIKVQISQEETKFKGRKNHARSTMESKQQDSREAINNSKENSVTEDVVVMDYAQPHRKPPIHNLEP